MVAMNMFLRVICPVNLSEQDKIVANCIRTGKPFILLKVCGRTGTGIGVVSRRPQYPESGH